MAKEIKIMVDSIRNLQVSSKVVEDKDGDREIVTQVKFECNASPKEFDHVLQAIAARHQVDVMMASPQAIMEFPTKPTAGVA